MQLRARAPGKVVVLGEYAVLAGGPALVLAVDRPVLAEIEPQAGQRCRLTTFAPALEQHEFVPPAPSGAALVDLLLADSADSSAATAWRATLDSRALYVDGSKLGIGSSAAALCAWAGAYAAFRQRHGAAIVVAPELEPLVALHRRFQGGRGSGLDIAASLTGGLIRYQLTPEGQPRVGSVPLPIGVGFAGIFAGKSASTSDFVARFESWRRREPRQAAAKIEQLAALAAEGVEATASAGAADRLLAVVDRYGAALDDLGRAVGAEIVTPEHRAIEAEARKRGVAYKVSGAGGGDLGLAMSADASVLQAFKSAVAGQGYRVIDLVPDRRGLVVEEHAE